MIRDEILLNFTNFLIKKICPCCQKFGHRIEFCPLMHYIPNKQKIINLFAKTNIQQNRSPFQRKDKKIHALKDSRDYLLRLCSFQNVFNKDDILDSNNEDDIEKKIFSEIRLRSNTFHNISYNEKNTIAKKIDKYECIDNFEMIKNYKTYYPQQNFIDNQRTFSNKEKKGETSSLGAGVNSNSYFESSNRKRLGLGSKSTLYLKKRNGTFREGKRITKLYELVRLVMDDPKIRKILKKKK